MKKIHVQILLILITTVLSTFYYQNFIQADITLLSRVRGRILLQVEQNGEAWYVSPYTDERYYLMLPSDAFEIMKSLGIGITNEDIAKIPIAEANMTGLDTDNDGLSDAFEDAIGTDINKKDTDGDGYNDKDEILNNYDPFSDKKLIIDTEFSEKHAGNILLQVEQNGEAWYLNPENHKRYFLGRPQDAFNVMRNLGLGITNYDLSQIPEFYIDTSIENDSLVANQTTISQIDPTKREYLDPKNPFTIEYPLDWSIKKNTEGNTLFIKNYKNNFFDEKKGLITVTYVPMEDGVPDVKNFEIKEKENATRYIGEKIEINGYDAWQEGFKYSKLKSFEISTYISDGQDKLLRISLMSAGDEKEYTRTYETLLNTVKFNEPICTNCCSSCGQ